MAPSLPVSGPHLFKRAAYPLTLELFAPGGGYVWGVSVLAPSESRRLDIPVPIPGFGPGSVAMVRVTSGDGEVTETRADG
jgi:hypothetical protein